MKLSDFDFDLPEELIALRPASPRDSARLLVVRGPDGLLEDHFVRDLPNLLSPRDILVANDTRVIRAALHGRRPGRDGGPGCRDRDKSQHAAFSVRMVRLRAAGQAAQGRRHGCFCARSVSARRAPHEAEVHLAFNRNGEDLDTAIEAAGVMPIPPYIASKRPPDEKDASDYQTLFARESGSVAAPTAGLHFTPELLGCAGARAVFSAPTSRCTSTPAHSCP